LPDFADGADFAWAFGGVLFRAGAAITLL
jgi:hypothetical protein